MQLLLQLYANCFETLQLFWSWSELHVLDIILTFSQNEFSCFLGVYQNDCPDINVLRIKFSD